MVRALINGTCFKLFHYSFSNIFHFKLYGNKKKFDALDVLDFFKKLENINKNQTLVLFRVGRKSF